MLDNDHVVEVIKHENKQQALWYRYDSSVNNQSFVERCCLKDVIHAIRDTAFVTSDFPVILSFENHCR